MNVFYDHLVNLHELHITFDEVGIPLKHRKALIEMADSTMHHEIFDLLMIEIPSEHKTYFLEIFSDDPSDVRILEWLKSKVPDVENKIKNRAEEVKTNLKNEVRNK